MPEVRVQVVKSPTVISTFAGCGGSSLGYKLAGFHELLAVEWDDNATGIIHPDCERYLTIAEMKRIASFPDDYQFHGDRKDRVSRIGNSVPPNLMRAIAEHIRTEILDKATE